MTDNELRCPVHGVVDGEIPFDGPLSNVVPTPILCDECYPVETIIGYDDDES